MNDQEQFREQAIQACIRWLTGPSDFGRGYFGDFSRANPHGRWIPIQEGYPPDIIEEALRRIKDQPVPAHGAGGEGGA